MKMSEQFILTQQISLTGSFETCSYIYLFKNLQLFRFNIKILHALYHFLTYCLSDVPSLTHLKNVSWRGNRTGLGTDGLLYKHEGILLDSLLFVIIC